MTNFKMIEAPKDAHLREHDCKICGHERLRKPVWLQSVEDGVHFPAGARCAAIALQLVPATAKQKEAEKALKPVAERIAAEARAAAYEEHKREAAAWEAFLLASAGPGSMQDQFERLGGFSAARAAYRAANETKEA